MIETGQDPRRFTEDLLRRLRDLVIIAAVPDAPATGLIDVPEDQAERLVAQAARFGRAELSRAADLVADGLTEIEGATAPRLLLELICARVLLPGADHATDGRDGPARPAREADVHRRASADAPAPRPRRPPRASAAAVAGGRARRRLRSATPRAPTRPAPPSRSSSQPVARPAEPTAPARRPGSRRASRPTAPSRAARCRRSPRRRRPRAA